MIRWNKIARDRRRRASHSRVWAAGSGLVESRDGTRAVGCQSLGNIGALRAIDDVVDESESRRQEANLSLQRVELEAEMLRPVILVAIGFERSVTAGLDESQRTNLVPVRPVGRIVCEKAAATSAG